MMQPWRKPSSPPKQHILDTRKYGGSVANLIKTWDMSWTSLPDRLKRHDFELCRALVAGPSKAYNKPGSIDCLRQFLKPVAFRLPKKATVVERGCQYLRHFDITALWLRASNTKARNSRTILSKATPQTP